LIKRHAVRSIPVERTPLSRDDFDILEPERSMTALRLPPIAAAFVLACASPALAATPHHAIGTFEVKIAPATEDKGDGSTLSRLTLDKTYAGALTATSKGEMLAAGGSKPTSAAYVAVERITGTLDGRSGSFAVVQHGWMQGDKRVMDVMIVPDSGGGALKGLAGTFKIEIKDGKHFYVLDYTLDGE
jgi:hypothetical protein